MKKTLIFLSKGLPISLILLALFMSGSNVMINIAIVTGLPWNIPGLIAVLISVLMHGGGIGMKILSFVGMAWSFIAITINASLIITMLTKLKNK